MEFSIRANRPMPAAHLAIALQVSPMRGNQSADFDEGDWIPEAETPPSSRSGCFKLDFDVSHSLHTCLLVSSTHLQQLWQLMHAFEKELCPLC